VLFILSHPDDRPQRDLETKPPKEIIYLGNGGIGMARRIPKEGKAVGSRGIDRVCVTSVMSEEVLRV